VRGSGVGDGRGDAAELLVREGLGGTQSSGSKRKEREMGAGAEKCWELRKCSFDLREAEGDACKEILFSGAPSSL